MIDIRIDAPCGTDIGPLIRNALPSLYRTPGDYGGRIILPTGEFHCSPVDIAPFNFAETRVVLEGQGLGTKLAPMPGSPPYMTMLRIAGRTKITGIDFVNPQQIPDQYAVVMYGVDQVSDNGPRTTDVTWCNFVQWHSAIRNENLANWGVERCGFLANTINIHAWNGGMGCTITRNEIQGGRGIIFEHHGWASEGRNISHNGMVLMKSGIEIYNGLAYNISDNNIDADSGDCIILDPYVNDQPVSAIVDVKIAGGWLSGFGPCGIRAHSAVFRIRVRDISFRGHSLAGVKLERAPDVNGAIWSPFDFQFSGCNLEGNATDFVADEGCTGISASNHFGSTVSWDEHPGSRFMSRDDEFDKAPARIGTQTTFRDPRGAGAPAADV